MKDMKNAGKHIGNALKEDRTHIRDAQILAVTFHRGTQRSYIFVLHPDCYMKYEKIITAFLDSEWAACLRGRTLREMPFSQTISRIRRSKSFWKHSGLAFPSAKSKIIPALT